MIHSPGEIRAMLNLLEDTDREVRDAVWKQMLSEGQELIDCLTTLDIESFEPGEFEALQRVKNKLNVNQISRQLKEWKEGERDLLQGMVLLGRYDRPELSEQEVSNQLDKIKLDAWLELNYELTALEKIRILNHIFFKVHGFKGDEQTFLQAKNSFIHRVLDRKSGNPITLSVIYAIVAQRLGIPVFGVNVPQHFMLAYADMEPDEMHVSNHRLLSDGSHRESDILFYIDPYNQGNLLNRQMLEGFVRNLNLEPQAAFFYPCTNIDILRRSCRNLHNAFAIENRHDQVDDIQKFLDALGD